MRTSRSSLLWVLATTLTACGAGSSGAASAPAPATSAGGASANTDGAPAGSTSPGPTATSKSATSPGDKGTPKGSVLTQLSTSDPDCALDAEGRPWKVANGRLERASVSIQGATSISCSSSHTCVVTAEAEAMCWGDNTYGALGDGTQTSSPDTPVKVKGLSKVAAVVVELSRSCARTTDGEVYCWGDREFAKAGDGTMIDGHKGREKPLAGKPVLGLTGAASLGVSPLHACATTRDGDVMCWGQCRSGACGLPPRPPWISRATKAAKAGRFASVDAAENATCGVDPSGGVACWGTSTNGVLGEGVTDTKPHDVPSKISLPSAAAEVAVGSGGHACARLTSGEVLCWGHNDHGQLGDGTKTDRKSAAPVKMLAKATRIAVGADSACALVEGGRLYCWGKEAKAGAEDTSAPVEITQR